MTANVPGNGDDRWYWHAACRGIDINVFYVMKSGLAMSYCNRCPVKLECRSEGDAYERSKYHETYGIRGGETAKRRIKRRKMEAKLASKGNNLS